MKFEETKLYKKHIKIIESFKDVPIVESTVFIIRSKIDEFTQDLEILDLHWYLTPRENFNDLDWFIHDNIIKIYKMYSVLYMRCVEVLYEEKFSADYRRSNIKLNSLMESED